MACNQVEMVYNHCHENYLVCHNPNHFFPYHLISFDHQIFSNQQLSNHQLSIDLISSNPQLFASHQPSSNPQLITIH